jgi:2-polyprenyl-3-methyl-5-hydroxy-6-metoxy-1,4-benzoquinol methylase
MSQAQRQGVSVRVSSSKYAYATGESDMERMVILNEICNPFSCRFLHECGIKRGDNILELGCGIGLMSQKIASMVGDEGTVLATDACEKQLAVARTLVSKSNIRNVRFQQLSAFDIDTINEKFDAVYIRFVLVHLENAEGVIRKMRTVVRPGGKIIIEDATSNDTFYSIPASEGIEAWHFLQRLQFEVQKSNDQYFAQLPSLLEREGCAIACFRTVHPVLDTPRERSIVMYISSLKDSLVRNGKIREEEFSQIYPKVDALAHDTSIQIYFYEVGQICSICT